MPARSETSAYRYEMVQLSFAGPAPLGSEVSVDLSAVFRKDGRTWTVKGFYAGDGRYAVRFLPEEEGTYQYEVRGIIADRGELTIGAARPGRHGPVRARGIHLVHADGTPWVGLGTTVYAMMHQEEALIDQTLKTLKNAPFTKVRLCLFPKHYRYNANEPAHFAFQRKSEDAWDTDRPDFAFWNAFENRLEQLGELGIQADLILFHPYDRWGLASLTREQNLCYLDYAVRRLAAYPHVWWSLANEYDLCAAKSMEDWFEIERFIAERDPFHHLLGNHNCFQPYDAGRPRITHMSWQTRQLTRIPEMQKKYGKPVLIDECCYEGNLPESWGSISGCEMTARFWRTAVLGGYCTHGETFYPDEREIVWWAKGGELKGESPARIAFLRAVLEELPGPVRPVPFGLAGLADLSEEQQPGEKLSEENLSENERGEQPGKQPEPDIFRSALMRLGKTEMSRFLACENILCGCCGEEAAPAAVLWYLDLNRCCRFTVDLPETEKYRIEVLDTWNMTRQIVARNVSGRQEVILPGTPWMAILAIRY